MARKKQPFKANDVLSLGSFGDIPHVNTYKTPFGFKQTEEAISHVMRHGNLGQFAATVNTEALEAHIDGDSSDAFNTLYADAVVGNVLLLLRAYLMHDLQSEQEATKRHARMEAEREAERKRKEEAERKQREEAEARRTGLNAEERQLLKTLLEKERIADSQQETDVAPPNLFDEIADQ